LTAAMILLDLWSKQGVLGLRWCRRGSGGWHL
jgi:hypothetical protein